MIGRNRRWAAVAGLAVLGLIAGCGGGSTSVGESAPAGASQDPAVPGTTPTSAVVVFTAASAPAKLSDWQVLSSDGKTLSLQKTVRPYTLNTPLFSDYSHKFRTIWLPPGTRIDYTSAGPLQFPAGAIVTKSFFYPRAPAQTAGAVGALRSEQVEGGETIDLVTHRMLETRLMVREPSGRWGAVTYVWDADQKDATLVRSGQEVEIELVDTQGARTPFTYEVPSEAQCLACHVTNVNTGTFEAIGLQAANLNRDYAFATGTRNQLEDLAALQMLAGYVAPAAKMTGWNDPRASLDERTRAYLEVNCASCHNSAGRAGHTGLWLGLQVTDPLRLGICKPPMGGQRNNLFAYDVEAGNAEASFLYYRISNFRLNSDPRRVAMPEQGRHVLHAEGNALVRDWIDAMAPRCP